MCSVYYSKLKKIEMCLYYNVRHFDDITPEQLDYYKIYVDEDYKNAQERDKARYNSTYVPKNIKEKKRIDKIIKWFHLTGEFKDFKTK